MIPAALEGLPGLRVDAEGACTIDLDAWRRKRDPFNLEIEAGIRSQKLGLFAPSTPLLRPFLEGIANHEFAKVQLAGPATVRWSAKLLTGEPASEAVELDQQIFRLLIARALALVQAVRSTGSTPVLFLDEPGLYALRGSNPRHLVVLEELKLLITTLRSAGARVGLHCCSNTDWAAVLELAPDILSIDARLSLDALLEERKPWLNFIGNNGTLALGVIPTEPGAAYSLCELVDSIEASLRATTGLKLDSLLLTPACGLGTRSVADAERIFGEVREVQRRLSQVLGPRTQSSSAPLSSPS
jgi:methionine synthase II (cobalamin-independent)